MPVHHSFRAPGPYLFVYYFSQGAILNFLLTVKCTFIPLESFVVK